MLTQVLDAAGVTRNLVGLAVKALAMTIESVTITTTGAVVIVDERTPKDSTT